MATTEKWVLGTIATLASTELNSLAAGSNAISSGAFNNTQGGGGGDGYTLGNFELVLAAPAGAFNANFAVLVWFINNADGTNYEDGGSSVTPARGADLTFSLRAVSTAQRIIRRQILIPAGNWYSLIQNPSGSGQAFAASGNTLKILPVTRQGV